jgi:hypothetical protein
MRRGMAAAAVDPCRPPQQTAANADRGETPVIIEWHTHVYPPEEANDSPTWDGRDGPSWAGRCPMLIENVIETHHRSGVDVTVASNASHYMRGKPEN